MTSIWNKTKARTFVPRLRFIFYRIKIRLPAGFATRATIATAEAAASAAEPAATFLAGLGLGLVDTHGAPVKFVSVKGIDSGLSLSGVGHRNEAESFAATGHTISHDTNGGNFAECCERRFETIVGRRISEVTNIDFHLYFPSV
jgi:hypothetical protein